MGQKLQQAVRGRSAWTSTELEADPQWRYRLSAAECDALHERTMALRQRGLDSGEITRADFELPALQATIERLAEELENGRGVVVIRGLPAERYDEDALRLVYWGIVQQLGTPISQNSKGQQLAEVTDHGNDLRDTDTRGYSTRARLGPHTDMCEMTSLLCVNPAKSGGESQVASAMSVFNRILDEHPEHLDILFRGFHHDLRGEGPTARIDEVTEHRVPVFSYHAGRLSCAFNPKISENGVLKRGDEFSAAERAALECVSETAARPDLSHAMWLEGGDIQVVNNHSVLHARDEYVDFDDPGRKRKLYRIWLQPHLQRPLTADFANRYNTGPRGGVAIGDGARYAF